ncbi:VWA domain-containing protein [Actinomadura logoneensis]|uniref:VWA domain-containing protein n=1 Tax=Actinomadura logoneensis TaxID=2293572 RepID=A0A372J8U4_9ACTN|nr:VWA domain-containing protein [Actinomadura logoneensis]RFU36397.1 VWA domain-containing protein [Actinomadura logoneensis]
MATAAFCGAARSVDAATGRAAHRPATVPQPTANSSVVTVRTGGDRRADGSVEPLPGVRLALFADEAATGPLPDAWAVCVADQDGDCSFQIPDTGTGGVNQGRRFWVGQLSAPTGWFTNPELRTGPGSGSGSQATPYRFQTPALSAGQTYRSTSDFMISDAKVPTASSGIWQQSRNNPRLPARCGLDVALVLDLSASVGSALPELKRAADQFTDALVGTPSRMALFTFDKNSPSTATTNYPALRSVSTASDAASFKRLYADWQLGKGTNWDQAMREVADAPEHYELMVVLTDGNPTYYGRTIHGDGSNTRIAEVENGIFSANAVKAKGTRSFALGVGRGVAGLTELNLRSISGPTAYNGSNTAAADYFQTADYQAAGQALSDLVHRQCQGSLTVVKQLVPGDRTGSDVEGAQPAGPGWVFDASTSTPGIGGLPDTQTTSDDGTGSVSFEPNFTGAASGSVTVHEQQHPGYSLVPRDGRNAECVNLVDGTPVETTNVGGAEDARPGFSVQVSSDTAVSCTVYDRPAETTEQTAHLTLVKKVKPYRRGTAGPRRWVLRATGPQTIQGRTGQRAVTHAAVPPGGYTLSEHQGPGGYRASSWRCFNHGRRMTVQNGDHITLQPGDDVICVITNTRHRPVMPPPHPPVTCHHARTTGGGSCRPDRSVGPAGS